VENKVLQEALVGRRLLQLWILDHFILWEFLLQWC